MTNPLDALPGVRKALYVIQYVVSGLMLLVGVGYAAAQNPLPNWYGVAAAVLSALWAYTGVTASTNVRQPQGEENGMGDLPEPNEGGFLDQGAAGLLAVALIVLILAFILFRVA